MNLKAMNNTRLWSRLPLFALIGMPMAWIIGYSLAYSVGLIGLFSSGFTLDYWQSCLSNTSAGRSILLSISVAAISTGIATLLAIMTVVLWPGCGKNTTFLATVCVGLGTPAVVFALLVSHWLGGGGWLARLAWHLGLIEQPSGVFSLVGDRFSLGIVVAQVCTSIPLLLLFFSQMWETIKGDKLSELAATLGASKWQIKSSVALPILLRRARSLILLSFMFNLGSFEIPLLLGRQSPQMLSVLTQRRTGQFDISQRPESFALSSMYFLVTSGMLILYLSWRRISAKQT